LRVALAPCSPFTVSKELMRDAAVLARQYGVGLHTHLAENVEDIDYSLEKFGMRPGQYIEELGWTGRDVWHAHCVQLNCEEIDLFAKTGTGIAHCPCSNMRLASGIAPVRQWRDAGVKVGLGVDGSASNDSGHLLAEARQAMLLQRVKLGANAMGAREALEIATLGGASVLNRDDIGAIAPGKAADFAAYKLDTIDMAGAEWDVVASLVFMGPHKANHTRVQGRAIVSDGQIATLDLGREMEKHRALVIGLINGS
jgi:8-oxoguanine deaminase